MNFAYGWAFSKPIRKVFYNITITGLSVAVALVIGTIELARSGRLATRPFRGLLDMVRAHRHQPAWVRDRRDVCRYLGHSARDLAAWADRGALVGAPGELEAANLVEPEAHSTRRRIIESSRVRRASPAPALTRAPRKRRTLTDL
jgi:hypothetical protein